MKIQHLTILGALGFALAGCSSGGGNVNLTPQPSNLPGSGIFPSGNFVQIERLSRPAVKELFEKFNDHQISNSAEPYQDPTLQNSINTFTNTFRAKAYGTALSGVGGTNVGILYPDEESVDLSQSATTASYLGVETKGATGSMFGGRAVNDDVIAISLGAVFGNTLAKVAGVPEDGQENTCLAAQNLTINASQKSTTTFPYLPTPH